MNENVKSILFFFGSGVSFPSGLPSANEITNKILIGEWNRHTDSNFYPGRNTNPVFAKNDITPKIQIFLKFIKEYADEYFAKRMIGEANYEHIYFIVNQLHNELTFESDNPALKPFIQFIENKFDFENNKEFFEYDKPIGFKDLVWRSEDFINCVIWQSLYSENDPIGFELITEILNFNKNLNLDIATLNHDLILEKYLDNNSITFFDGFSEPNGDFCYFTPNNYSKCIQRIKLYKLHGSLNWYRLRTFDENKKLTTDFYAKLVGNNHWNVQDKEGNFLGNTLESYPIFLSGTGNKLSAYNSGIIKFIHLEFDEVLIKHDLMIMSGYGWNDKGINIRLMEWIMTSDQRKLIILHEDPESIKKSRSAMWHRYDDLVKWGRLIPINKWMSDTKLDDIKEYLILSNNN